MQDSDKIESPFKFLRPYGKEDTDIFFCRDDAAKELYHYVNKNRLVIIYGPPDCGKTSLIQCGLASWFDATEWAPFFIHRCENINYSLFRTLNNSEVLMQNVLPSNVSPERIVEALGLIEKRCLRPVYLLFDQFEDTLVSGSDDEIKSFVSIPQRILSSDVTQSCHLVFILGGGHLDRLRPFEESIPGFSSRKVWVPTLMEGEVAGIVRESCKYFNITLNQPDEQMALIMQSLSGQQDLTLSYLQVYMDRLWKDDYARTYPDGYTGEEKYAPLEFTSEEIKSLGSIKEVILRFLIERTGEIQKEISGNFPTAPNDVVTKSIDALVSIHGQKIPVGYTDSGDSYQLPVTAPLYLRKLPPALLYTVVRKLESSRIIRLDGYNMQLSNRLIADVVYDARPPDQKRADEIAVLIKNQYEAFAISGKYLNEREIRKYEDFLPQLNLEEKYIVFFRKSIKRVRNKNILKVTGYLVLPLIAVLVRGLFELAFQADQAYALYYLSEPVNTINNKHDAIRLAKTVYDKEEWSDYSDVMKQKFLQLFKTPEVQGFFSEYSHLMATTTVDREDVDISGNGEYLLLADKSTEGARYKLFRLGLIDTIFEVLPDNSKLKYAYFINHTDSILLAFKRNAGDSVESLTSQFKEYPNAFYIYNCRNGKMVDSVFIEKGYLLLKKEALQEPVSDYDSYQTRYTDSGYLLVPIYDSTEQNLLDPKLRIYAGQKFVLNQPSSFSVSISKDKKSFGIGYYKRRQPVIEFYTEGGKVQGKNITGISFADFTANGSVIFIRKGAVILRSRDGDTSRRYFLNPDINYAWADGKDERLILARSNDSLFSVDVSRPGNMGRFKEKLVGVSFSDEYFITIFANDASSGKPAAAILKQRSFTGKVMDSFPIPAGVKDFQFNDQTKELLVLTDSNRLQLLNKSLDVKASFQLTPNDLFGFSKNGGRLYYVRDNWLSVFINNDQLADLSNFDQAYAWLQRKEKDSKTRANQDSSFSKPIYKLRNQYDLNWPSQFYFKYLPGRSSDL